MTTPKPNLCNTLKIIALHISILIICSPCEAESISTSADSYSKIIKSITVNQTGRGDFTSIQSAVASIVIGNSEPIIIEIAAGKYNVRVIVPKGKRHIKFIGNIDGQTK